MQLTKRFSVDLPDWCADLAAGLPDAIPDPAERMKLAIELSRLNVEHGSGGPFGAVVANKRDGRLLALGVNRVEPEYCSSAHAEIVALSLAQARLRHWDLAEAQAGPVELASSCEPCAMCLGAIPWSGVAQIVCGASKADAEACGFDEGARDVDWVKTLKQRGIAVETGVQRAAARQVLESYRASGARIYNPGARAR